ncbi:hypothetical protein HD554DRAFT_2168653 [Boletus coccyginus]|nr:hypothetical protein HD554DRAFT_2168653 [Boletus coccyginus]
MSLTSVPVSDRQMTLSAIQIMGCVVESASAIVVSATGAQLSKEFIHGDTSPTKEKYDIHEQATSSEHETISLNGYLDCYTSSRNNDKTAMQLTHTPQQSSTECK